MSGSSPGAPGVPSGSFGETLRADQAAQAEAAVAQASVFLPLATLFFLAAWCGLAPFVLDKVGLTSATTTVERFLAFGARRLIVIPSSLGVVVVLVGLIRSSRFRAMLARRLALAILVKLVQFVPVVGAIAVVLMSVFVPLMRALSGALG